MVIIAVVEETAKSDDTIAPDQLLENPDELNAVSAVPFPLIRIGADIVKFPALLIPNMFPAVIGPSVSVDAVFAKVIEPVVSVALKEVTAFAAASVVKRFG